ncbi:MAG: nucleotidyl transferase AbiEii/AbiGii toxin family protein [Chlorobi bacterium]|nr:nucleotidyl transferase AbiEii/AbiGii toxin family protein [Chlorobiota bacterium]
MLYTNTVNAETLELLKKLQKLEFLKLTRLVGGTALALQFGHRESIDLNFFGQIDITTEAVKSNLLKIGKTETISASKNINIFTINGTKTDFVNYPFNWLFPALQIENIVLADIRDIAAMKLSAITNRGTKKDFVDIYYILKQYSFNDILSFYQKKYNESSLFLVLKSFAYFSDADAEPMPVMKDTILWNDIKFFLKNEIKQFEKKNRF